MRTDPDQDHAASARRRLEEFARLWSPPASAASATDDPPEGPATTRLPIQATSGGRHAVTVAVPPRTLLGAFLHRRHVGLIALAAVLFVLVAIWWTARGSAEPMPVADTSPAAAPVSAGSDPSGAAPSLSSASASATSAPIPGSTPGSLPGSTEVVVVDVAGKVRRPAVVTLPAGSRVIDALRKAGGARSGVDLSGLNLARVLVDGEQVLVGSRSPAPVGSIDGTPAAPPGADARTDLNTATAAQLEELPGIGPVTAQKIIEWRTENGAFTSADDLLEVDGIGPKTLASIEPEVTW